MRRRVPHAALLVLAALLAGTVLYLTWPSRSAVYCERLPQLTSLAFCAAALLVVSFRALAGARTGNGELRVPGGAAVLAALAFFLCAHHIAEYRKPCTALQHQLMPGR